MDSSDEIVKIQLKQKNTLADILKAIQTSKTSKLVFCCPRNFPLLAEIANLKKIKSTAEKAEKKVSFITLQKWVRDIIISQGIEVSAKCPEKLLDLETSDLDDFLGKVFAEKNTGFEEQSGALEKKQNTPPPEFSMQKIAGEKSFRGLFFFGFLVLILLLIGILLWISPRATITIKPKISAVPITQNIIVALPEATIPEEEENLPTVSGIFVETEVAGNETFPSTERTYDLTNARGRVTLFNETTEPKFLIPSRLSTDEGAIFRFNREVTIPPKQGDKPGTIQVEIVADEYDTKGNPIGERGNIEAGTEFFFPALRADSRELYYAKANQGPLVGGSTLTHYFINEKDFESAQEIMHDIFRTRAIEKLRKEMNERSMREGKKYVFLDRRELMQSELIDIFFPEHLIGKEAQTFQASAKMKLSGLVFDQAEVVNFLAEKVKATQDHRKKLIRMDENSAQYRVMESEKLLEEKWVKLSVSMFGTETLDFNSSRGFALAWQRDLKKEIADKTPAEVKNLLTNYPEIEDVKSIKIAPFWTEKLPHIYDQITLKIIENY